MIVSWCQQYFLLPKAQDGADLPANKKYIVKEKKWHNFNMHQAASLGGQKADDLKGELDGGNR